MTDRSVGIIASASAAALFGSAYVATAFQLHGFTPLGAALWRSGLAVLVLLAIAAASRQFSPRLGASDAGGRGGRPTTTGGGVAGRPTTGGRLVRLLVIGLCGGLVFMVGMNVAVSEVGPTVASFVAGLYAITAALFAPILLGERLSWRAVVGFVVALVGTALLAELGPSPSALAGLAAGGLAAVSFGLYLVLVRRWSRAIEVGPLGISITTALVTAVGLGVLLGITDVRSMVPRALPADAVVATTWLVTVTAAGPVLTTIALRRIEAPFASSLLLVNPIAATVLAAILLAERPSLAQLGGGLLVLAGMALATDLIGALRRRSSGTTAVGVTEVGPTRSATR